jgi:hypothetical protein
VRERAYPIWQREGSPDGRTEQVWRMAEEELLAEPHRDQLMQRLLVIFWSSSLGSARRLVAWSPSIMFERQRKVL